MSDSRLTADGARYWLAMDGWAHDEAAWLLQGFDPHRMTARTVRVGGRMVLTPAPEPDPLGPFVAMLSRAGEAAALRFPAAPAAVISWATAKGMRLPALLVPAGTVQTGGRWTDEATKATQAAARVAREDARLGNCEAQGMVFDKASLRRLPYGIGKVAQGLCITRQSLTTDVQAALKRRFAAARNGAE